MKVILQPDDLAAARLAAGMLARQVRDGPASVLGLATGRTMERLYDELVRLHREDGLDFSGCRTFNLDEYVGLPATDSRSYRATMEESLFQRVNLDPARTHLPDGMAADLAAESAAYETRIAEAGGIDLQLLGIGTTGHIGFNEPLSSLRSRTRAVTLTPETLRQNASFFGGDPGRVPRRAVTMGVGTILAARRIVMLVTGAGKAGILARALEGPLCAGVPASAVQLHPACCVIVDEAAAGELRGVADYRWLMENDPDRPGMSG